MQNDFPVFIRNNVLFSGAVDDELALFKDDNEANIVCFNATAKKIWELMEAPITLDDLIIKLGGVYDTNADGCRDEVLQFLDVATKEALVSQTIPKNNTSEKKSDYVSQPNASLLQWMSPVITHLGDPGLLIQGGVALAPPETLYTHS